MAIVIEATYSKKLGLPQYSSHQFSVTLRTELGDLNQVTQESNRLYSLMQQCVDREIQNPGFLPQEQSVPIRHSNNGNGNGNGRNNGNGHDHWECSDKQKGLILKVVSENQFDKNMVDELAQERFGKSVRQLNRLEASGLIEELFEMARKPGNGRQVRPAGGVR